ncbi:MAG TPA: ABC transporter permease [Bryobacteraceae bacterium]|nr:ABC transporter permease [Bryobacteraceae bacterium]
MFRRRKRTHHDFSEEVESHIELEADRLREQGLTEADALAQARRAFGNVTSTKERFYESTRLVTLEQMWHDVRYGFRSLMRNPWTFAVATGSLALAISASTAAFSLGDALLVRSLPVQQPEQLRILQWVDSPNAPVKNNSGYSIRDPQTGQKVKSSFSWAAAQAFAAGVPYFSEVAGFAPDEFVLTANGTSDYVSGSMVSGSWFHTLRADAALGRTIRSEDDQPGKPRVAVLSQALWTRRFHQDPKAIGAGIYVNNQPVTIVGVMPARFTGIEPGRAVDLYIPMAMAEEFKEVSYSLTVPTTWWVQIVARMRPGATDAAAAVSAHSALGGVIQTYAATPGAVVPQIVLKYAGRGLTLTSDYMRQYIYVLSALVLAILLIACTNLANLLLARTVARSRDVAVRLSLGASRQRILRHTVSEALIIAVLGALVGVVLAAPLLKLLTQWIGADQESIPLAWADGRVLAVAVALCFATALAASLLPGLRAGKLDLAPALKATHVVGSGGGGMRLSRLLIPIQVALSLLLLVAIGLFGQTLLQLAAIDLGFRTDRILTLEADASRNGYKEHRLAAVYEDIREKLAAIPGVESVALSHERLLAGNSSIDKATVLGRPEPAAGGQTHILYCSDSFFSTMRIPLLLGKGLPPGDRSAQPPVAVVNEAFAKRHFGTESPIGQRFTFESPNRREQQIEIIGVVKNTRYSNVRDDAPAIAHLPYTQNIQRLNRMSFAIRSALPTAALAEAARKTIGSIDPAIPVAKVQTQEDLLNRSIGAERMFAMLVSGFGLLAALLAAIGLYALMAWSASRRTAEIGIRMALGARRYSVQWLVVRQSLMLAALGVAAGIPAAVYLSKYVESMLYGVKPTDPISFVAAVAAMIVVIAAAAWIPARRASRVNAMNALRAD